MNIGTPTATNTAASDRVRAAEGTAAGGAVLIAMIGLLVVID